MVLRRKNAKPGAPKQRPKVRIDPQADRRSRFVAEYLVDRNATQAAIRAGYSPHTAYSMGSRLLKEVEIADAIAAVDEQVRKRLAERYEVNAERIQRELATIGFGNLADYGRVDRDGQFRIDLTDTTREAMGALSSVKTRITTRRIGEVDIETVSTELRLGPKREALVDLGKITGLFRDGVDVTVPVRFIIERTAISAPKEGG